MVSFLMKSHASSNRKVLKLASLAGSQSHLRPVKHIKEKRLQDIGRIAPSVEVEVWKSAKERLSLALSRESRTGRVRQRCRRSLSSPTILAKFESVRCSGQECTCARCHPQLALSLKSIRSVDRRPRSTHERMKEELQVFLCRFQENGLMVKSANPGRHSDTIRKDRRE